MCRVPDALQREALPRRRHGSRLCSAPLPDDASHRLESAALRPGHESAIHSVSFPAKAGNPSRGTHSYTVCATALRCFAGFAISNSAADWPVSAASTRPDMCARRSSLAFLSRRSRPKITLSVAELER